jgi:hypothetical protein
VSLLLDIAGLLQQQGIAQQAASLFIDDLSSQSPDPAIALFKYGGGPPVETHNKDEVTTRSRFQVLGRSTSYVQADGLAFQVWRLLRGVQDVTINGTRYLKIQPQQEPFSLPRDENQRSRVVCNYEAWKEPS